MKRKLITIFYLAIFTVTAVCQDGTCNQSGWVEDKDPAGTNVRESPSIKSKVIGNIPRAKEDGEQAIVEIVDYANGWLKITLAETVEGNVLFKGAGWISAKKVTAVVETNTGKPAPLFLMADKKSKKVGTIPNETSITIVGIACFGFKVDYKGKKGWLSSGNYCGNPVTTCP